MSLELRHSAVTERADVVFPVAPVVEKAGTFVNWEGRHPAVRGRAAAPMPPPTCRVLRHPGRRAGRRPGCPPRCGPRRTGGWALGRQRAAAPSRRGRGAAPPGTGEAVLAGWRMLLDAGRLQDGEPHLAGTARPPVARLSAATAAEIGAADGDPVTVSTDRGADHAAAGDHRHARPGGVAAAELPRLGGAPRSWA